MYLFNFIFISVLAILVLKHIQIFSNLFMFQLFFNLIFIFYSSFISINENVF